MKPPVRSGTHHKGDSSADKKEKEKEEEKENELLSASEVQVPACFAGEKTAKLKVVRLTSLHSCTCTRVNDVHRSTWDVATSERYSWRH